MKIIVLNKRKSRGGEYVGRGSVLGNPYRIGVDGTRHEVIEKYKLWIEEKIKNKDAGVLLELHRLRLILESKSEVHLSCFCAPLPCHADVISEILKGTSKNRGENNG